jgi:hypothetical protein
MASILRVNTLTDASSNNSTAMSTINQGTAKCWLFGTNAAVLTDSFNMTSGTDNGTGDFTYTIANDMANATYSISATSSQETAAQPVISCNPNSDSNLTTGTFRVELGYSNIAGSALTQIDKAQYIAIHGDLA